LKEKERNKNEDNAEAQGTQRKRGVSRRVAPRPDRGKRRAESLQRRETQEQRPSEDQRNKPPHSKVAETPIVSIRGRCARVGHPAEKTEDRQDGSYWKSLYLHDANLSSGTLLWPNSCSYGMGMGVECSTHPGTELQFIGARSAIEVAALRSSPRRWGQAG